MEREREREKLTGIARDNLCDATKVAGDSDGAQVGLPHGVHRVRGMVIRRVWEEAGAGMVGDGGAGVVKLGRGCRGQR